MSTQFVPWFYRSCARYMIKPTIETKAQVIDNFKKLQQEAGASPNIQQCAKNVFISLEFIRRDVAEEFFKSIIPEIQFLVANYAYCQVSIHYQRYFLTISLYYLYHQINNKIFKSSFDQLTEILKMFEMSLFKIPEEITRAYHTQFLILMAFYYEKQGMRDSAEGWSIKAFQLESQNKLNSTFDCRVATSMNLAWCLIHQRKFEKASSVMSQCLPNIQNIAKCDFSHLFMKNGLQQRIGFAQTIAHHLNGTILCALKTSWDDPQFWFKEFDAMFQGVINYFGDNKSPNEMLLIPIIRWAFEELLLAEFLAKKQSKSFITVTNLKYRIYHEAFQKLKDIDPLSKTVNDIQMLEYERQPLPSTAQSQAQKPALSISQLEVDDEDIVKRARSQNKLNTRNSQAAYASAARKSLINNYTSGVSKQIESQDDNIFRSRRQQGGKIKPIDSQFQVSSSLRNRPQLGDGPFQQIARSGSAIGVSQFFSQFTANNFQNGVQFKQFQIPSTAFKRSSSAIAISQDKLADKSCVADLIRYKYGRMVEPFNLNEDILLEPIEKNKRKIQISKQDDEIKKIDHFDTIFDEAVYQLIDQHQNFVTYPFDDIKLDRTRLSSQQLELLAAYRIQRFYRKKYYIENDLKRKVKILINIRIIQIQAAARKLVYQTRYRNLKKAALVFQQRIKQRSTVCSKQITLRAIITIQKQYRGQRVRDNIAYMLQQIIKLQAAIRKQKQYSMITRRKNAVIKIQRMGALFLRYKVEDLPRIKASFKIQARTKAFLTRRTYKKMLEMLRILQATCKRYVVQKNYQKQQRSSTLIQSYIKMQRQHRKFLEIVDATTSFQCYTRRFNAMILKQKLKKAVDFVQTYARYRRVWLAFQNSLNAAFKLKSYVQYQLQQKYYRKREMSALSIQDYYRRTVLMKKMKAEQEAAKIIQRYSIKALYEKKNQLARLSLIKRQIDQLSKSLRSAQLTKRHMLLETLNNIDQTQGFQVNKALLSQPARISAIASNTSLLDSNDPFSSIEQRISLYEVFQLSPEATLLMITQNNNYSVLSLGQWSSKEKVRAKQVCINDAVFKTQEIGYCAKLQRIQDLMQNKQKAIIIDFQLKVADIIPLYYMDNTKIQMEYVISQDTVLDGVLSIQYKEEQKSFYQQFPKELTKLKQQQSQMKSNYQPVLCRFKSEPNLIKYNLTNYYGSKLLIDQLMTNNIITKQFAKYLEENIDIEMTDQENYNRIKGITKNYYYNPVPLPYYSKATIVIQSLIRGYLARQLYYQKNSAILVIQSYFRMQWSIRYTEAVRESISLIQNFYRYYLCGKSVRHVINQSVVTIQSHIRRYLVEQHNIILLKKTRFLQHNLRSALVIIRLQKQQYWAEYIQNFARGFSIRKNYQLKRTAAIILQCAQQKFVRFNQVIYNTKIIQRYILNCINKVKQQNKNMLILQRYVHGFLTRLNLQKDKMVITKIQQHSRNFLQYRKEKAVDIIIKLLRQYKSINYRIDRIKSATTIQKFCRSKITIDYLKQLVRSIMVIKTAIRKRIDRVRRIAEFNSVLTIQKSYRKLIARMTYIHQFNAAIILQSIIRGQETRKLLRREELAAKVIQRRFYPRDQPDPQQLKNVRRRLKKLFSSSMVIQSMYRGFRVCKTLSKEQKSVVPIQTIARKFLTNTRILRMKIACEIIQERYFQFRFGRITKQTIALLNYQKTKIAVQHIQLAFKCRNVFVNSKLEREATTTIQKYYRMFCFCRKKAQSQKIVLFIQRTYRLTKALKEMYSFKQVQMNWKATNFIQKYQRSALTIQSVYRRIKAQKQLNCQAFAVMVIQRFITSKCMHIRKMQIIDE